MFNKLRGKIIEVFGSQKAFADYLGKTNTYVSQRLNGNLGFTRSEIILWSDALGITLEEIGPFYFADGVHKLETRTEGR